LKEETKKEEIMAALVIVILGVVLAATGLTGMLGTMLFKREELF
jgi:hypothetical protein